MHVFPVALEVAVIEASVVSPAAAKSREASSLPTIWIGMAATLLCVEHVVYQRRRPWHFVGERSGIYERVNQPGVAERREGHADLPAGERAARLGVDAVDVF